MSSKLNNWNSELKSLNNNRDSQNIHKLASAKISTVRDLVWIFPTRVTGVPELTSFYQFEIGENVRGKGNVLKHQAKPNFYRKGKRGALLYTVELLVQDIFSEQSLSLTFFNCYPAQKKKLESLEEVSFWGELKRYRNIPQVTNPKLIEDQNDFKATEFNLTYPTVNTVPGKYIKKLIDKIPNSLWQIPLSPQAIRHIEKIRNWRSLNEILKDIHLNGEIYESSSLELKRLAYEEFFIEQIDILKRKELRNIQDVPEIREGLKRCDRFLESLPYKMTQGQADALSDISEDINHKNKAMMRLIQGDVGCGKTVVAFASAYIFLQSNFQIAMMAPTEALAQQHYENALEMFKPFDINIALLLGSTKAKQKKNIYDGLSNGAIQLIVGTHSLIQEATKFKNLGLIIIDEQHKFGVKQRLKLAAKGKNPHTLLMTATPIPRSLCLTQYGDLDISIISEMPNNKKSIKTRIVQEETFKDFLTFLSSRLKLNEQIYIVVPAIEESEHFDFLYLEKVLQSFKRWFPDAAIEGLHGKLSSDIKSNLLQDFKNGLIQILVSTSVVEVGLDVHNATVMAILNPDRFGLSSLHQLRGRVGRGKKSGFCFLVFDKNPPKAALQKLKIMEQTNNGFIISEEDLKNRGYGNLFGTEQSGHVSYYKVANPIDHIAELEQARKDFFEFIEKSDKIRINELIPENLTSNTIQTI